MHNVEIAESLESIADLLEFTGANPFRVRAYRNAGRTIRDLGESIEAMCADETRKLTDVDTIGADLAQKIAAINATGTCELLDELRAKVPASVLTLLRIPGLGPKKALALHQQLGVTTLAELRAACEEGKVRVLKGFAAKTEELILAGLSFAETTQIRMLWAEADSYAQLVLEHLRGGPPIEQMEMAGSYRRGKETIGDLDVLVVSQNPAAVMDRFATLPGVAQLIGRGDTKMSVRLGIGLQVDLRVVAAESFGAALQYFTGSKDHNVVVRGLAKKLGLKINEYGVFRDETYIAGRTEEEVYGLLDLPVFPPELREARREFDWAAAGALPTLVTLGELRGDLHMHTTATDGKATLAEMVEAARARGLAYIAITDHSKRVSMANGLDGARLREQWRQIDALNAMNPGVTVLKGIECDILERGGLDLPDEVLAEADWVVASVHYGQNQPREEITRRILGAIENPHVDAIAHPTGRLINRRKSYDVDMATVFDAARRHRKMLELNANPHRLDLDDVACMTAKDYGIPIVISTDAHSTQGLDVMRHGVQQARRAGLTAADIANTRPWPELKTLIGRRR